MSFEVKQGEVLGIIGRNGAGKSTLLKILSRVTAPTSGEVRVKGRIASLLEVGTGFHPELTGRENIFLNGAILGMTKSEIRAKFDEIVAFSEVEQFIDTPVKRYSSGMHVRLAFAVAAHLEPEILIVDEVLAVGDALFQKRCVGKMRDVSRQGRTVLFVSHNMAAVTQLCTTGMLVEKGCASEKDGIETVVSRYLCSHTSNCVWTLSHDDGDEAIAKKAYFRRVELCAHDGTPASELDVRKPFRVCMEYSVPRALAPLELGVRVLTPDGRPVLTTLLSDSRPDLLQVRKSGAYRAEVQFPAMFLMPGNYLMNVAAHAAVGEVYDLLPNVFSFTVLDTGTSYSKYGHNQAIGVVMRQMPWTDQPAG